MSSSLSYHVNHKQVDVIVMWVLVVWENTMNEFQQYVEDTQGEAMRYKTLCMRLVVLCKFKIVENCMAKMHHKQNIKYC